MLSGCSTTSTSILPILGSTSGFPEDKITVLKDLKVSDLRIRVSELHLDGCVKGRNIVVEIDGPINSDTSILIEKIFDLYGPCVSDDGSKLYALVAMNSSGGSLNNGYKIGRVFRKYGVVAVVNSGQVCASACAVAFLGARIRSIKGDGALLFHAPYRIVPMGFEIDCSDREIANSLNSYYREMLTTSSVDHIFTRTMSYCSSYDGWKLNKAAAEIFGITNF